MLTRVRLLATFVVLMVVLGSCTMVQARNFARTTTTPTAGVTAATPAPTTGTPTTTAEKADAPKKTQADIQFARRLEETKRREIVRQARFDTRRAAMAVADTRAAAKKQAEINTALRYLAAVAEAEAKAADPYGYKRVEQYVSDAGLKRLRDCESTDRYWVTNPSGKYRGAYQFDFPTWNGVAERWFPHLVGVDPIDAPPEAQDAMTRALWSERGRYPWPECGLRV